MLVRRRVWATHYTRVIGRTVSTFVTSAQVCAASAQLSRRSEQSFEAVIHPCRITDRHLRIEYRSGGDGGILMNSDLRTGYVAALPAPQGRGYLWCEGSGTDSGDTPEVVGSNN